MKCKVFLYVIAFNLIFKILLVFMAGRSASRYGTSGRRKGDVVFTDLNISDYYYFKIKRGRVRFFSFKI